MLRLVTSNNGEVFRHLGSAPFRRVELEHRVASDAASLLALVRSARPDLALIDTDIGGQSGFELCRQLKDDPELSSTHVILLLSQFISRRELDGIARSRCDDVLALPISSEDFYHHIAQVAGLPFRRAPRVTISGTVSLGGRTAEVHGQVLNVSPRGLGVRVSRPLEVGAELAAHLQHGGEERAVAGRVAWCRPAGGGQGFTAGIELEDDIPIRTRLLLEELSLFDVSPSTDGDEPVVVRLQGDFTEAVDFGPLRERLARERRVVFDMGGVRYVSSAGIKEWCDLVAGLAGVELWFRHCSMAFATQAAMLPMVLGGGEVLSLEAPYRCEACDRDDMRLLEIKALLREGDQITPPALRCASCGGELEFDDVPGRYFAFLLHAADPPRNP
jgi:CheY-like chemotaxis protein